MSYFLHIISAHWRLYGQYCGLNAALFAINIQLGVSAIEFR